jgi:hypothetical protein
MSGFTACGSGCVDEQNDQLNCGQCGKQCTTSPPGSMPICVGGVCSGQCTDPTKSLCAAGCFDLQNDPQNCGLCGHACPSPSTCHNGMCV